MLKKQDTDLVFSGAYSKQYVKSFDGFKESRDNILNSCSVTLADFIKWGVWNLGYKGSD